MTKRHTKQNTKQSLGQYFTTNADAILDGYQHLVVNKQVMDPFAGGSDLLNWAMRNGATDIQGYDLVPQSPNITQNDSLVNPPSYSGYMLVTNPPYLSANKCRTGDRRAYDIWQEGDYYKCHLASLDTMDCDEALEIVPSNFFCESRDSIRRRLFKSHYIASAKYWNQPVFDDATTGICVLHLRRGVRAVQQFKLTLLPDNIIVDIELKSEYKYLYGEEFFEYIKDTRPINVIKTDVGMSAPNTNIIVGLLDNGARAVGLSYNEDAAIYCNVKSFTTYQLTLPEYTLTDIQQRSIVELFQSKMRYYRDKYHSMFLSNYMGPAQKILSRSYVHTLLSRVMMELGVQPHQPSMGGLALFEFSP
jgi:hypothetical protein